VTDVLLLGTMNTMVVSITNPLEVAIELSVACSRAELSQTSICPKLGPGESGSLQLVLTNVTGSTVSGGSLPWH